MAITRFITIVDIFWQKRLWDEEFLLVQTVDLDDVAYHRATDVPYLQDRRVETYQKLTEMY